MEFCINEMNSGSEQSQLDGRLAPSRIPLLIWLQLSRDEFRENLPALGNRKRRTQQLQSRTFHYLGGLSLFFHAVLNENMLRIKSTKQKKNRDLIIKIKNEFWASCSGKNSSRPHYISYQRTSELGKLIDKWGNVEEMQVLLFPLLTFQYVESPDKFCEMSDSVTSGSTAVVEKRICIDSSFLRYYQLSIVWKSPNRWKYQVFIWNRWWKLLGLHKHIVLRRTYSVGVTWSRISGAIAKAPVETIEALKFQNRMSVRLLLSLHFNPSKCPIRIQNCICLLGNRKVRNHQVCARQCNTFQQYQLIIEIYFLEKRKRSRVLDCCH